MTISTHVPLVGFDQDAPVDGAGRWQVGSPGLSEDRPG
jgi:hypothetical protein